MPAFFPADIMSCLPLPWLTLPDFAYMSPALNPCAQLQLPKRPTKANFAYMAPAINPCTQLQLPKRPTKTSFAYVALASYPCTAFVHIFRLPFFIDQKSLKPPGKSDFFRLLFSTQADICTRCWSFTSSEAVIHTNLVQEKQAKIIYAKVITLQSIKISQAGPTPSSDPVQHLRREEQAGCMHGKCRKFSIAGCFSSSGML